MINNVRITITECLDQSPAGTPFGVVPNSGWTLVESQATLNTEAKLATGTQIGQRISNLANTGSAGRLMFVPRVRIPVGSTVTTQKLAFSVFTETSSGSGGGPYTNWSQIIPDLLPGPALFGALTGSGIFGRNRVTKGDPIIEDGWVTIPLSSLVVAGADSFGSGSEGQLRAVELMPAPGTLFLPFQPYWIVMKEPLSYDANGVQQPYINVYIARETGSPAPNGDNDYWAGQTGNGIWNFHTPNDSLVFFCYSTNSLSNPPTTPLQGGTTQINVYEPVLGTAFPAQSRPGQDQVASEVQFTTAVVARRNARGNIDVAFPMSAGNVPNLGRLTYSCEIGYIPFK